MTVWLHPIISRPMDPASPSSFRFGNYELQRHERRLLQGTSVVALRSLTFDVLVVLVEAAGRLVSKDDLRRQVWKKVFVDDNALQAHVSALRKLLGRDAIATVARTGYRFALAVTRDEVVPKHNLPYGLTRFIGREREVADVQSRLASARLLTLVGAGGCGKTRLALEVAHAAVNSFVDGAWIAELAPIADPSMLVQVVAKALSIDAERGQDLLETVLDGIRQRRMLLLLDNAEHLIDECAQLAYQLLRRCPGLVVLVTSRERLGIDGEHTHFVPSLTLPADATREGVLSCEAARLFIDRSRLHQPNFEVPDREIAALASICCRLDGIALALELAVPLAREMPLNILSKRLDDRFDVLTDGSRVALPRHRTLRSLIDWSHDLLSASEKVVFRRLSVFAGGAPVDLASTVCADEAILAGDVPQLLAALAQKNLLTMTGSAGADRAEMLETVRQYALDRLRISGEEEAVRERHFNCLAELAQFGTEDAVVVPRLAKLGQEHDNVRAALSWVEKRTNLRSKGLEFAASLHRFWQYTGYFSEGRGWMARLLKDAPSDTADASLGRALHTAGALALADGDFDAAVPLLEGAISCWRELGVLNRLVPALGALGDAERNRGNPAAARQHLTAALDVARGLNDERTASLLLGILGRMALDDEQYDAAQAFLEEGLTFARRVSQDPTATLLFLLAELLHERGELAAARDALLEAVQIWRVLPNKLSLADDLLLLSEVEQDLGNIEEARRLSMEALETFPRSDVALVGWLDSFAGLCVALNAPLLAASLWGCAARHQESGFKRRRTRASTLGPLVREAIGSDAFGNAFDEGRTWSLEQAFERARDIGSFAVIKGLLPGAGNQALKMRKPGA